MTKLDNYLHHENDSTNDGNNKYVEEKSYIFM